MHLSKNSAAARATLAAALISSSLMASAAPEAPLQKADCGTVERHVLFSPELGDSVRLDIWLPEHYNPANADRYPVIYMHDGQNLYDRNSTWNGQAWEMDSVCCRMIAAGEITAPVIVGIHSDPAIRASELLPVKALTNAALEQFFERPKMRNVPVLGDKYVEFVVNTLKPWVDTNYSTLPDRGNTMVMGSSMGGLMSLYLICERPDVFGSAGCVSIHWSTTRDENDGFGNGMLNYVRTSLPDPATHKIYFDCGTETIDTNYAPWLEKAVKIAEEKGYRPGENLDSYVDEGAAHTETAWAARVNRPLRFMLGK